MQASAPLYKMKIETDSIHYKGGDALNRIKPWEELTIQDNFLFQKVMRNKRICKHLIEKILNIKIKKITYPDAEKSIDIRLDSKSVRLDVYVQDEQNVVYDIEMQTTDGKDGELAKRTRYYQAMIDMDVLEKGHDYEELNKTYIIFICTFDLFKKGLPVYTFQNICREDDTLELGDQTHKLFLNSKSHAEDIDPDIAAFLAYVDGKDAEGAFVKHLDEEVQKVKRHDETRREYMTLAMELERQKRQGFADGMAAGKAEGKLEMALHMLQKSFDHRTIAEITQLSADAIEALAKKNHLI